MKTKFTENYICHKNSDGKLRYFFTDGSILEIVSSNKIIFKTVYANGEISYMDENNDLNQNNGPALATINNEYEFWLNGKKHNNSGPDSIKMNGEVTYHTNGQLNNFHGPAFFKKNGDMLFYLNGQKHNYYGPAIIKNTGEIVYYRLNQKHNEEIAAIQDINDNRRFFIDGEEMEQEAFEAHYNKVIKEKII
jgi:hypothetical protein